MAKFKIGDRVKVRSDYALTDDVYPNATGTVAVVLSVPDVKWDNINMIHPSHKELFESNGVLSFAEGDMELITE